MQCDLILSEREQHVLPEVIRPTVAMNMVDNDALHELALDIEAKLKRAFDTIGSEHNVSLRNAIGGTDLGNYARQWSGSF